MSRRSGSSEGVMQTARIVNGVVTRATGVWRWFIAVLGFSLRHRSSEPSEPTRPLRCQMTFSFVIELLCNFHTQFCLNAHATAVEHFPKTTLSETITSLVRWESCHQRAGLDTARLHDAPRPVIETSEAVGRRAHGASITLETVRLALNLALSRTPSLPLRPPLRFRVQMPSMIHLQCPLLAPEKSRPYELRSSSLDPPGLENYTSIVSVMCSLMCRTFDLER